MSLLDKFTELAESLQQAIKNSPLNDLLGHDTAVVTITDRKSGKVLTLRADYFHDGSTIYLIGKKDDLRWKNLDQGALVIIRIKDNEYNGWAQVLKDRKVCLQALSKQPEILMDFSQKQKIASGDSKNVSSEDLVDFFQKYLVIKGSITR